MGDNSCRSSNLREERQMYTVICRALTAVSFALFTAAAYAQAPVALAGQVSSAEEGAMEGVVVSARKDGSTISSSVVTDAQGRFAFPAARLGRAHYSLHARAADAAAPRRESDARGRARRQWQEDRGMARQRQPERARDLGIPAQVPAAPHGQVDARDHHGIRPAESADPAARRSARSRGQRLVLRLR